MKETAKKKVTLNDLALMVGEGFNDMGKEIRDIKQALEDIKLKFDHVPYKFEVKDLEKRMAVVERKVGIR